MRDRSACSRDVVVQLESDPTQGSKAKVTDLKQTPPSGQSVSSIVEEFAEETGVFGLNVLRSRLSRIETIFWLLCTLFFGCLTIRDTVMVTDSYFRQATLSLVSQITNSTIVFDPAPTLAFSHRLGHFDFSYLLNDTSWLDHMTDEILKAFLNSTPARAVDRGLQLEIFETMFHDMVSSELTVLFPSFLPNITSPHEWASRYRNKEFRPILQSSLERVYDRFRAEHIDFSALLQWVATQFCAKLDFFIEVYNYVGKEEGAMRSSPCAPENIVVFDDKYIGLRLSGVANFTDPDDYALVSWDAHSFPSLTAQKIDVDFSGTTQTINERENVFMSLVYSGNVGERFVVSLSISGVYVKEDQIVSRPCSSVLSSYDCKQRCYVQDFVAMCACYPLYFSAAYKPSAADVAVCPYHNQTENVSFAGLIGYLKGCSRINASDEQARNARCDADCLPDCRTRTFVATVESDARVNSTRRELMLTIQSFTFPFIEERLAMTLEGFISQFGGILGLYIGVSFAALVHIPIFALRKMIERCRPFSKQTARNPNRVGLMEMVVVSDPIRRELRATTLNDVRLRLNDIDQQLMSIRLSLSEIT